MFKYDEDFCAEPKMRMGLLPPKGLNFVKRGGFVVLTRNHFLVFGIK